jgi:hypothetical protein
LVDRYGEAIEGDLPFYFPGMRLLDLLSKVMDGAMTPREVLVYIDRLPPDSALAEAMAQDDELAAQLRDGEQAPYRPRITEFGPTNQLLTKVVDRLTEVVAAVAALGGGKAEVQFEPRPETAAERLASRVEEAGYDYLLERIEEARAKAG